MELVTVLTSPEGVFRNDLLSAVGAAQVEDLVIVEDDFDVPTDLEELSLS